MGSAPDTGSNGLGWVSGSQVTSISYQLIPETLQHQGLYPPYNLPGNQAPSPVTRHPALGLEESLPQS